MNHLLSSLLITLAIFGTIGGGGYLLFENVKLKKEKTIDEKEIKDLKYENKKLRGYIVNKDNQIKNYRGSIKAKNNLRASTKYKQRTKSKKTKPKETIEYIYNGGFKDNVMSSNNKQTQKRNSYTNKKESTNKIYQKFSRNIKLISDSRIKIGSDNKLSSNSKIAGRYYAKPSLIFKNQITNVRCNLKQNLYNVVDDCSMNISENYDLVYLGEMNAKSIQDFNYKTHMIECEYNKKHGVMHDCKIKIYL